MGIRAVTENISNDTDPLLVGPMTRAFDVVIRILKLNQAFRMPKVYQSATECISKFEKSLCRVAVASTLNCFKIIKVHAAEYCICVRTR
jgi:hypothetical protein